MNEPVGKDSRFQRIRTFVVKHAFAVSIGCFVMFFTFFDDHSILKLLIYKHQESLLEQEISAYRDTIAGYEQSINELSTSNANLEKFARERLLMKRPNEDVYIVE